MCNTGSQGCGLRVAGTGFPGNREKRMEALRVLCSQCVGRGKEEDGRRR